MLEALERHLKPAINIIKQRPVLAIFEICLRCNSQCGYCDLPLNEGRYEMTRSEIKTVFTQLYGDGVRIILLQGGEPTLRKDLLDIIEDLHEIGFSLSLITNGTRLSQTFIDRLVKYPVSISISLDTLDRDTYKKVRGADQLRLVLASIERLKNYPHPKYLTCILSDANRQDTLDVIEFSNRHKFIPVIGAYHWDIDRYGKSDVILQYKKEVAIQVFDTILKSEKIPRGYFRNYIKDNIDWLSDKPLKSCDAGRYSIAIDCSGNVAPCLALEHKGNLLTNSLDEILNNFDKDAINSCSTNSSCNMLCSRVIGSNLRNPMAAMKTVQTLRHLTKN